MRLVSIFSLKAQTHHPLRDKHFGHLSDPLKASEYFLSLELAR